MAACSLCSISLSITCRDGITTLTRRSKILCPFASQLCFVVFSVRTSRVLFLLANWSFKMDWVLNASHEINVQSKHPTIIAVCIVLILLMSAIVVLRIYLHAQASQIRADDYVIIATALRGCFLPIFGSRRTAAKVTIPESNRLSPSYTLHLP